MKKSCLDLRHIFTEKSFPLETGRSKDLPVYPGRAYEDMHLMALYLETVNGSEFLAFEGGLLKLLGCFE